jgi:hypothetical protein
MANSEFFHVYKTGPLTVVGFQGKHLSEPRAVDECRDQLLALFGSDVCQMLVGAIVNCCVMKMFLSGEFLQNSVLEGTSFDDERHLFVAA